MARFLIDVNLPYRFSLWRGDEYVHVFDLDDRWPDARIWQYATEHGLTIITKDTDFSDWIMVVEPPPRVVHLRLGNMKINAFYQFAQRVWPQVEALSRTNKLVTVYADHIVCVE